MSKSIKVTKADRLFSLCIRNRDKWRCVRCKKQYHPPTNALQCSHFWGRGNYATRFHRWNCDAACYGCHAIWEANKQGDYRNFKIKQLGMKKYKELERLAKSTVNRREEILRALEWLEK